MKYTFTYLLFIFKIYVYKISLINNYKLSCRNTNCSTDPGLSLCLLLVTICPALENMRSEQTDVAGIPRYFIATGNKFGNVVWLELHQVKGFDVGEIRINEY